MQVTQKSSDSKYTHFLCYTHTLRVILNQQSLTFYGRRKNINSIYKIGFRLFSLLIFDMYLLCNTSEYFYKNSVVDFFVFVGSHRLT